MWYCFQSSFPVARSRAATPPRDVQHSCAGSCVSGSSIPEIGANTRPSWMLGGGGYARQHMLLDSRAPEHFASARIESRNGTAVVAEHEHCPPRRTRYRQRRQADGAHEATVHRMNPARAAAGRIQGHHVAARGKKYPISPQRYRPRGAPGIGEAPFQLQRGDRSRRRRRCCRESASWNHRRACSSSRQGKARPRLRVWRTGWPSDQPQRPACCRSGRQPARECRHPTILSSSASSHRRQARVARFPAGCNATRIAGVCAPGDARGNSRSALYRAARRAYLRLRPTGPRCRVRRSMPARPTTTRQGAASLPREQWQAPGPSKSYS